MQLRYILSVEPESFLRAMRDAGVQDPSQCYLIDDSALNIDAAQVIGCIYFKSGSLK
jgi:pyrimidine and pyridine-specific 5'-nucleotidase